MPSRIDHVIIAAPDLDRLEDTFRRLGFSVVGGGTHPLLGTRNRIIILGDGYIELLGIADVSRVSPILRERIALGSGWVGYALQSDDIAAEAQAMRERGVNAHGPNPGRLVAPDGTARSWRVVTIGTDDLWAAALPLPFLIQHDSTGQRHQRELAGGQEPAPHANSASALGGVTLLAADPASLRERYERAYALHPVADAGQEAGERSGAVYRLARANEWIRLMPYDDGAIAVAPASQVDAIMRVRVRVADMASVERALWLGRLPATPLDHAISVTLPDTTAHIEFSSAL
ncbi:MAG TPA: VOC family protein [Ktedonobacterales bacterium]|nr:VOC family protein [Ktedonobacterales bacterium]